jgi:hypothetical protein
MDSESADNVVFEDYRELEPVSKSLGQYLVAGIHFAAALLISVIQLNDGLSAWFVGYGVVTPILLIIHGCIFFIIPNDSWYRERMVPFILSIFMTTEIETDRYLQYQRRSTMLVLILGWLAILLCQMVWTFGITSILPAFATDDILILFAGELVGWTVILGPLFLYFLLLILIALILDRLLTPRYADIKHLFDIEKKWNMERDRRAKDAESVKSEDAPTDSK